MVAWVVAYAFHLPQFIQRVPPLEGKDNHAMEAVLTLDLIWRWRSRTVGSVFRWHKRRITANICLVVVLLPN